jgi:hypothetical protein
VGKTIEIDVGLLDILTRRRLHSEQIRCLLVVVSRPGEILTLADFHKATSISKPHVCRSIKALTGAGLLSVTCGPDGKRRYHIPGFIVQPIIHNSNDVPADPVQSRTAVDPSTTTPGQGAIDGTPAPALAGNMPINGHAGMTTPGNDMPHAEKPVAISRHVPLFGNDAISANGNIPAINGVAILIGGQWVSIGGKTSATPEEGVYSPASNKATAFDLNKQQAAAAWEWTFGAKLPPGADMNAVHAMLTRKQSGKLADVKNPVGYLLAMGKGTVPKCDQVIKPDAKPVTTVTSDTRIISDAEYQRQLAAYDAWEKMSDDDRKPYFQRAEEMKKKAGRLPWSLGFLAQRSFVWDQIRDAGANC